METEFEVALHVRLADVGSPLAHLDVTVQYERSSTVAELIHRLLEGTGSDANSREFALVLLRTARALPHNSKVVEIGLLRGDALLLRRALPDDVALVVRRETDDAIVWLHDERGRDAGRVVELSRGQKVELRTSSEGDIWIDDPTATCGAAYLEVDEHGEVTLSPRDGHLLVDGFTVRERAPVEAGQALAFGDYSLLRLLDEPPKTVNVFGQVPFLPSVANQFVPLTAGVVQAPHPPPRQRQSAQFPWETLASSALMAGFFVVVFDRAVFALLVFIPILVGGLAWIRRKRLDQKQYDADVAEVGRRVDRVEAELSRAATTETEQRRANHPHVRTDLFRRAYRRLGGTWTVAPDSPAFLSLRIGTTTIASLTEVAGDLDDLPADSKQRFDAARRIEDVPAVLDLGTANFGVCGVGDELTELVAEATLHASINHAPRDLRLIIGVGSRSSTIRASLELLAWLPHVQVSGKPTRFCSSVTDLNRELVRVAEELVLLDEGGLKDHAPHTLIVLHESMEPDVALMDRLFAAWPDRVHLLWFGAHADAAPPQVDGVIKLTASTVTAALDFVEWTTATRPTIDVVNEARERSSALDECSTVARSLAPLLDPRDLVQGGTLPDTVDLLPLLSALSSFGPPTSARNLFIALGMSEAGPLVLDLVHDGPHVLVGGTTGAGKSEALETMTASGITRYAPDELMIFAFDFKGGATFAGLEGLAHTMGSVTNLSMPEIDRGLRFLDAELQRRMKLFDDASRGRPRKIRSYEQYRRAVPAAQLPRVLVLFDEFAALVGQFEAARSTAIRIAQQGRSLGIHVVIATQRPSTSTVDADVQANVGARIALRTVSEAESHVIIGGNDAALIPSHRPGRAVIRHGSGRTIGFQGAFAGGPRTTAKGKGLSLSPLVPRGDPARPDEDPDDGDEETSFEAVLEAAPRIDPKDHTQRRLLPSFDATALSLSTYNGARTDVPGGLLALGECDDITEQHRFVSAFDLRRGALLVAGGIGAGKSSVLGSLGAQARRAAGKDVDLIALDSAGDDLAESYGATFDWVVQSTDRSAVALLLEQLEGEIQRRQREGGVDVRPALLVIDDIQQLYEQYVYKSEDYEVLRTIVDLLRRGRRVGVYAAASAPSQQFGNAQLRAAFAHRVQLRPTPDDEELIPAAVGLPVGVGLDQLGRPVKCFMASPSPSERAPLASNGIAGWFGPLPESVQRDTLGTPSAAIVGFAEQTRKVITTDARRRAHILIVGRDSSERSAAADHFVTEFARLGHEVIVVPTAAGNDDDAARQQVESIDSARDREALLVVEDASGLPRPARAALTNVCSAEAQVSVLLCVDASVLTQNEPGPIAIKDILRPLAAAQRLLYLSADPQARAALGGLYGGSLSSRADIETVRGRALWLENGRRSVVQVPLRG